MESDSLFTRDEVLAGFPARRASTLLFLIETRVSYLLRRSQKITERFLTADAEREQELAFFEAFTLGRKPDPKPTIQNLERYAAEWGQLVPDDLSARAALAHTLGQKYTLAREAIPGIRSELGLDGAEVQAAYERLYGEPIAAIYPAAPGMAERLRWLWSRLCTWLENLPPFWAVYALTLTEAVGGGILALPIAVAEIGPLAGIVVLVALGLVNVLTVAFMAEAVTRSGTIRYGSAYIGRMVADFLGEMGSVVLSVATIGICALTLLAFYIGFAATMAAVIPLPPEVWMAVLFIIGFYFVSRETLHMTIASAIIVGAINIGLILVLSACALTQIQLSHLTYFNVPFLGGAAFDSSLLGLIFGVILTAYFGHMSVSTVSKEVMRRDSTGRPLLWGAVAAQATVIVLYCIWVLAVNGAVDPRQLAAEAGTALVPLAEQVGPVVSVFGGVFMILGMGMGAIHSSIGLFNLTRERLPIQQRPTLDMPRGRARVLFQRFGGRGPQLALTYLGIDRDRPLFEFLVYADGKTHRVEQHVEMSWRVGNLPESVGVIAGDSIKLAFDILGATHKSVRVQVDSPMRISYHGDWNIEGLTIASVLDLPRPERRLTIWMMRQADPISIAAAAECLGEDVSAAQVMLTKLEALGFVKRVEGEGEPRYTVEIGYRRPGKMAQQLLGVSEQEVLSDDQPRESQSPIARFILGEKGRKVMSAASLFIVFLLAEWSMITGAQSFSGVLSLVGVLVVSLLGGIFPVLLLISARKKGEFVPKRVYRLLGNPVILALIYLLSLSGIFLHGLVIWEGAVARGVALLVGGLAVVMTIIMVLRGAFSSRAVVELREDQKEGGLSHLSVVAGGRPTRADVRLQYADGEQTLAAEGSREISALSSLRSAVVRLIDAPARELKVWLHRVTQDDDSEGLPSEVEVLVDGAIHAMAPNLEDGQATLALTGELDRITITLAEIDRCS
jgi:amino acid permease/predicted transcriptional regulator